MRSQNFLDFWMPFHGNDENGLSIIFDKYVIFKKSESKLEFQGKKILVVGLGKTGMALVSFLFKRRGAGDDLRLPGNFRIKGNGLLF